MCCSNAGQRSFDPSSLPLVTKKKCTKTTFDTTTSSKAFVSLSSRNKNFCSGVVTYLVTYKNCLSERRLRVTCGSFKIEFPKNCGNFRRDQEKISRPPKHKRRPSKSLSIELCTYVAGKCRAVGLCVVTPTSILPDHLSTSLSIRISNNSLSLNGLCVMTTPLLNSSSGRRRSVGRSNFFRLNFIKTQVTATTDLPYDNSHSISPTIRSGCENVDDHECQSHHLHLNAETMGETLEHRWAVVC